MQQFRDSEGVQWDVVINVTQIKRVRDLVKVDIYRLIDEQLKPLAELLADPCKLVDVLYVLCRDQSTTRGVSDEQFGQRMYGNSLNAAAEAFVSELLDFFPEEKQRLVLRKVYTKTKELQGILLSRNEEKLDTLDLQKVIQGMEEGSPKNSSTAAPELSGLTPDH